MVNQIALRLPTIGIENLATCKMGVKAFSMQAAYKMPSVERVSMTPSLPRDTRPRVLSETCYADHEDDHAMDTIDYSV